MGQGEGLAESLRLLMGGGNVREGTSGGKAVRAFVFLSGCSIGLTLAVVCFVGRVPLWMIAALAAAFVAVAAACRLFALRHDDRKQGTAQVGDLSETERSAPFPVSIEETPHPRKASTAQIPRDFNPRQVAVEELARIYLLTPREKEVLEFMARGRDVQFISESLVLSINTVRTHVQNIFSKLGVHSKQEILSEVEKMCDVCLLSYGGDVTIGEKNVAGSASTNGAGVANAKEGHRASIAEDVRGRNRF